MNGQLVTRYIKNWADTTEIKGCSSFQTLYRFDSDVLRNRQQKHTAKTLTTSRKKNSILEFDVYFLYFCTF